MSKEEMASNSRGALHSNRHGSRSPPFILIGLLVVIVILAFNYWTTSQANRELDEKLTEVNRRHSELNAQYLKRKNDLLTEIQSKERDNAAHKLNVQELQKRLSETEQNTALLRSELSGLQTELNNNKGQFNNIQEEHNSLLQVFQDKESELVRAVP